MDEHDQLAARLRDRVLLALLGSLTACADPPASSTPKGVPPASDAGAAGLGTAHGGDHPTAIPSTSAASASPSESPAVVAAEPSSPRVTARPEIPPAALPPGCFAPFGVMRAVGTGEPAAAPPPSSYDKDGCLPKSLVSNGCCVGANGGPAFRGNACCYTFPKNAPCCGRPFVIAGEAVAAGDVARSDWLSASDPRAAAPALDPETRGIVAEAWLADARMEHASIASFARFVADLLALGAPADLIREAGAALLDEVEHARLAYAMAAEVSGEARGPAPLAAFGAAERRGPAEIVAGAVIEGCVGETAAALLAQVRAAGASHPSARRALSRIAEDEARHAELAFRFVRWALASLGPACADWVDRAMGDAAAFDAAPEAPSATPAMRAFGVMDAREASRVHRSAVAGVVIPALAALRAG